MKRVDLPYLEFKTVKGREYIYFRKGRFRRRMPSNPDSEEFSREYWAIRNGKQNAPKKTSWEKLIVSYYSSAAYLSLSKGTKQNYRRHCEAIREKNGTKDVCAFRRKHALAARDALQGTWSKANERVAVLSILCRHAVDLEWIDRNPVVDIRKLSGGEYAAWPDEKLAEFERECDQQNATVARTTYELAVGTGQRLGDCIKMRWDDFDGEYMSVVQEKTNARIWVYCPDRLQSYLSNLPHIGTHIVAKNLTEPLDKRTVQTAIEEIRKSIGVMYGPDRLVPHGWRYTAARLLADAGCADAEIQAVTGHKTLKMVQKYRAQANQRAASKRAQQKRDR